ncbi:hypothetical protein VTO42DRAFT_7576 [Malbranchea cinnamomea]
MHDSTQAEPSPLLTAVDARSQVHLVVGSNLLASARCTRALEVGASPVLIAPPDESLPSVLRQKVEDGSVSWVRRAFRDEDLRTLGREEVDGYVDAVFVTLDARDPLSSHISTLCRRLRIPVNVADAPELCSFTLLSTYSDGPLHVGITTSGRGCKLAARIKREIAAYLPPGLGAAVEVLGRIRRRIWEEDRVAEEPAGSTFDADDSTAQNHAFNALVRPEDPAAAKTRRIRWLSQLCEYWPLQRLASITSADMERILEVYQSAKASDQNEAESGATTTTTTTTTEVEGKIILAGSGPGHPGLLTRATYHAIQTADLILSDKLVPTAVLDLIPRRTEVHIARKFPGNADKAQEELLELGLRGLQAGKTVLRLKQGDPYLYGRGAEEYDFFRDKGYTPVVLPGITSALSAPLFADIPPTHRGVADQVLICTGTGRHGVAPDPPSYLPSQTVVFLMALHRLSSLVESLTSTTTSSSPVVSSEDEAQKAQTTASRCPWPKDTPCAVIERASCADQRVIRTTLEHVCLAVEEEGSRPPGLLVVGKSCEVLHRRPPSPLGSDGQATANTKTTKKWVVEEGYRALDDLGIGREVGLIDETGSAKS